MDYKENNKENQSQLPATKTEQPKPVEVEKQRMDWEGPQQAAEQENKK